MRFNLYLSRFFMFTLSTLLITSFFLVACSDDDDGGSGAEFDASATLNDFANTVVLATYTDLDVKAASLLNTVRTLQSSTTQANLDRAQSAWKAARRPWEQSEAFLFGPVDTQGLDPALDSWPVNRVDLDAVLASGDVLTASSIDGLEDTLKGFHTIEYLLFRDGDQRKAGDITPVNWNTLLRQRKI